MPATSAGITGGRVPSLQDFPPKERSMAKVVFTPNIQRHVALPEAEASGRTVRDVLEAVFTDNPQGRGYVLDDQSGLRKHMTIFVDGRMICDRSRLTDPASDAISDH